MNRSNLKISKKKEIDDFIDVKSAVKLLQMKDHSRIGAYCIYYNIHYIERDVDNRKVRFISLDSIKTHARKHSLILNYEDFQKPDNKKIQQKGLLKQEEVNVNLSAVKEETDRFIDTNSACILLDKTPYNIPTYCRRYKIHHIKRDINSRSRILVSLNSLEAHAREKSIILNQEDFCEYDKKMTHQHKVYQFHKDSPDFMCREKVAKILNTTPGHIDELLKNKHPDTCYYYNKRFLFYKKSDLTYLFKKRGIDLKLAPVEANKETDDFIDNKSIQQMDLLKQEEVDVNLSAVKEKEEKLLDKEGAAILLGVKKHFFYYYLKCGDLSCIEHYINNRKVMFLSLDSLEYFARKKSIILNTEEFLEYDKKRTLRNEEYLNYVDSPEFLSVIEIAKMLNTKLGSARRLLRRAYSYSCHNYGLCIFYKKSDLTDLFEKRGVDLNSSPVEEETIDRDVIAFEDVKEMQPPIPKEEANQLNHKKTEQPMQLETILDINKDTNITHVVDFDTLALVYPKMKEFFEVSKSSTVPEFVVNAIKIIAHQKAEEKVV